MIDDCFPEKALATAAIRVASHSPSAATTCGWREVLAWSRSKEPA